MKKFRNKVKKRGGLLLFLIGLVILAGLFAAGAADEAPPVADPALSADFNASATTGTAPFDVLFTDVSAGTPIQWNWSFGDGTYSEEQNPAHTYLDPGTYSVTLTVSADDGFNDTLTRPDFITVAPPVTETATPSPDPTTTETVPAPVVEALDPVSMSAGSPGFTLHVYGTGFTESSKVRWNGEEKSTTFLSGTELLAEIPSSDLALPPNTRVPVGVSDDGGGGMSEPVDFSITGEVRITEATETQAEALSAEFSSDLTTGPAPLTVQFTDLSTGNPDAWNWDFGDGYFSEEQNPVHTYVSAGVYSVVLATGKAGVISSVTKTDYIAVTTPARETGERISIRNGGFETGDLASWTAEYGEKPEAPGSYSLITVDPGSNHRGVYGANITLHTAIGYSPSAGASLRQEIGQLQPGDNVSFWVKVPEQEHVNEQLDWGIQIRLVSDDGQSLDIASLRQAQDWTLYELKCPPGIHYGSLHWSIYVNVRLGMESDQYEEGNFIVYIDDFSVEPSSPPMPDPGPAPEPGPAPACTGKSDLISDGGFESQAGMDDTSVPSFPMSPSWHTEQSGAGGASVQTGLNMGPNYGAVLSLDDAGPGDWISISQPIVTGGARYCSLSFRYYSWMTNGRTSDFSVFLDDTEVWHTHDAGDWSIKEILIDLSSFSGTHDLKFLQSAVTGGQGEHADWFLDDIRLMANPALPSPPKYCFTREWGSQGTANGQFFYPYGIATDLSGNVFVSDASIRRIQKFDPAGKFLTAWSTPDYYTELATDGAGNVYVVDQWGSRILKYDPEGNLLATWGTSGWEEGQLYYPTGIAVDTEGNSYVTPYSSVSRIQKFDPDGNFLAGFGNDGSGNGEYDTVGGIAVDQEGNIYVADTGNNRILKYDANGNLAATWGTWGLGYGEFDGMSGVTVDNAGNIFVLDRGNSRVQEFDPSGQFLTTWGTPGSDPGEFTNPEGIAAGPTGDLYIVDTENHRVQEFSPCGQPEKEPVFPVGGGSLARIRPGPIYKDRASIDGNRVVWTEGNDIWYHDLSTGVEGKVSADPSAQDYARISGDRVVYMDGRLGSWHIFLTDVSTGAEARIGTGTVREIYPDISGNLIVWEDARNKRNELWLYDLSTGQERQIATGAVAPYQPAISGSRVVFTDMQNGNSDIYLYDINTGIITQITSGPGYVAYPDISGDIIVWTDMRGASGNVYMYNIATRTETQLGFGEGAEQFPRISGNLVTWHWTSRAGPTTIILHDIRNQTSFQITPNEGMNGNPDISGNRVAWRYAWGGNDTIMVFTWDGNPIKYLVADLHARYQSVPALEPLIFNDTSYGVAPTRWSWDFGDGTTSALRNPVHTYQAPGLYTVSLKVSNNLGMTDTATRPGYVQVTAPLTEVPVPDFTANPAFGVEPLPVSFFDQSSGFPSAWLWDFGDGTTSTEQSPYHVYATGGTYTVSLTASNHLGPNTTVKENLIEVVYLNPPKPAPPFPTITDISPLSVTEGSPGFTLQVTGTNFTKKSVVFWNFKERTTTLVSGTEVRAEIPASDVKRSSAIPVDVRVYTYDSGLSNGAEFRITAIVPTVTPTPEPKPGELSLIVSPHGNTVDENQDLPIDIRISDGNPVSADSIEIWINGALEQTVTQVSDYTYQFKKDQAGTYSLRVVARKGGWSQSFPPGGTLYQITVYGDISNALLRAYGMRMLAHQEIDEAETIAAGKIVDFVVIAGQDFAVDIFAKGIVPFVSEFGAKWLRINGGDWFSYYYTGYTCLMEDYYLLVDQVVGHFVAAGGDIIWDQIHEAPIPLWIQDVIDDTKYRLRSSIDANTDLNIPQRRSHIDSTDALFQNFIRSHPDRFPNTDQVSLLFNVHQQPIINIVDNRPTYPFLGGSLSMRSISDKFENTANHKGILDILLPVEALCIMITSYLISGGALAGVVTSISLDTIAGILVTNWELISLVLQYSAHSTLLILGAFSTYLVTALPFVATMVDNEHTNATVNIQLAVLDNSPYLPNMYAESTRTFQASQITSMGQTIVLQPDGTIAEIFAGSGMYTPNKPGGYSAVSYSHGESLFAYAEMTGFEVINPDISLDQSTVVLDHDATVHVSVCNHETTAYLLGTVLGVKNSNEEMVYLKGDEFTLQPDSCTGLDYTISGLRDDAFTAKIALFQAGPGNPLKELVFPIKTTNNPIEDMVILGIDSKAEYSPLEPIRFNLTIEGFSPGMPFSLKVPKFSYENSTIATGGVEVIPVTLPPLQPDFYTLVVVAEKDGKSLDSRQISFYVTAEGVGIIALRPDELYHPSQEPLGINFTLKDLLMNPIDAEGHATVIDPDGLVSGFSTPIGNGWSRFLFTPHKEGTYIIEGSANRPGWRITGDRTLVIVGNMSPLLMDVQEDAGNYTAKVYANGLPAASELTLTSTDGSTEMIRAVGGIAIFNRSGSFTLMADRMFYSPAYYSYVAPETLPTADFEVNETAGTAPLAVRFTDLSDGKDLSSWTWAFGDSTYAYVQNPEHVYDEPGTYSVTLTVANSSGSNYLTRTDYITVAAPVPPAAGFTAEPVSGKVPLRVTFTDTSEGEPRAWTWAFGDGGASEEPNPVHEYATAGTYDVSLTVTNKAGANTRTETGFVTVLTRKPPVADFTGSPESGNAPLGVTFTDLSTGSPSSWQWDFGDGAGSGARKPSHEYMAPGRYTVSLTVVNPDGTDTKTRQEYITVTAPPVPPVARFTVSSWFGKAPLSVTFRDGSTGSPTSWRWTFGDGGSSDLPSPSHTYNRAGAYLARLRVSNPAGSDTTWRLILVLPGWWPWR